jgi:hypothetical protein
MAATQKISVAMGLPELRLAKTAAKAEGMSLSAFVTQAVRRQLEERERLEAGRAIVATFAPEELATPEEQRELLALWNRTASPKKRPARRRASKRGASKRGA